MSRLGRKGVTTVRTLTVLAVVCAAFAAGLIADEALRYSVAGKKLNQPDLRPRVEVAPSISVANPRPGERKCDHSQTLEEGVTLIKLQSSR
jgi:hypothetical protein